MAKLKYDRPINVNAGKSQFVTIPKDEVWKVTVTSNIDGAEPFTNLYGGGTHSIHETSQGPYQASPSSTSKSNRIHGGDSPCLENLFSIGRFGSKQNNHRVLWYRKTSCGKLVTSPAIDLGLAYLSRIFTLLTLGIEFLPEARRSKCGKRQHSAASPLRSWRNNAAEGVTLYA